MSEEIKTKKLGIVTFDCECNIIVENKKLDNNLKILLKRELINGERKLVAYEII